MHHSKGTMNSGFHLRLSEACGLHTGHGLVGTGPHITHINKQAMLQNLHHQAWAQAHCMQLLQGEFKQRKGHGWEQAAQHTAPCTSWSLHGMQPCTTAGQAPPVDLGSLWWVKADRVWPPAPETSCRKEDVTPSGALAEGVGMRLGT